MYELNEEAYNFELIETNNSLFNSDIIQATYIIHLVENGRYDYIKEQILKYNTTNKIYILHNKGYKNSKKQDYIDKPPLDLVDAYITIFKHASNNKFSNILCLEDDFIFDEKITDLSISKEICNFIISKNNDPLIYYLGVIPSVIKRYDNNHFHTILGLGSHSIIYNSKFIKLTLNTDQKIIFDWDLYLNGMVLDNNSKPSLLLFFNRFMYKECMSYQPFVETDNSNYWGSNLGLLGNILKHVSRTIIKSIKLDSDPINGFKLYYEKCIKI